MEGTIAQLQVIPLNYYIIFCAALFAIGVVGVLVVVLVLIGVVADRR